jgi:hypothetical protein
MSQGNDRGHPVVRRDPQNSGLEIRCTDIDRRMVCRVRLPRAEDYRDHSMSADGTSIIVGTLSFKGPELGGGNQMVGDSLHLDEAEVAEVKRRGCTVFVATFSMFRN